MQKLNKYRIRWLNHVGAERIRIVKDRSLNKFALGIHSKENLTDDLEGEVVALLKQLKMEKPKKMTCLPYS